MGVCSCQPLANSKGVHCEVEPDCRQASSEGSRKGTTIAYNQLNLPEEVSFVAGDYVRYLYDASGYKLAKVVDGTVSADNTRIDYSGSFLYENGELKTIFTGEGRIIPFDNNGAVGYKYLFQDKNVPKGQGYSRFAQKRTSMNGFSGSIVRFFVATDCFTALGCYDYLFVERYNQLGMYYPFKKRTVSH